MVRRLKFSSGSALMFAGLAVGVLTALATAVWLGGQESGDSAGAVVDGGAVAAPTVGPTTRVVVLREPTRAGTELTALLLRYVDFPRESLPDGVFHDIEALDGRVSRFAMVAGEPVLESRLVNDEVEPGAGLAFAVPPGFRAVSAPFSELLGAGGLVIPGDRVDVLVATTYERLFGPEQVIDPLIDKSHPVVVTVLQNVLVVAVGQEVSNRAQSGSDPATQRPEEVEVQPSARSLTLAVTAEQAQELMFASQEGTLGFALRAFGDDQRPLINPEFKLDASSLPVVSR
jgi:pilus assembly protein CpaB